MRHEEVLGRMAEYREGSLNPAERAALEGHLADCGPCRKLAKRWKDEMPSEGFISRVMARLGETDRKDLRLVRAGWALRTGWAVAAALLVAAFWHPEKSWVKADRAFAFFGPTGSTASPFNMFPGGTHHE